jgi:hypothetical protein
MDENVFWLRLWSIVGLCIVAIVLFITVANTMQTKMYVENGYEQVTDVGYHGKLWQKRVSK